MPVRAHEESGFTMIMTVIGITLVALLAAVAVTAVNGSAQSTTRDIGRKQAYEAALAGINEYAFHLHENSAYWTECTEAQKSELSALNQEGSTANRRPVPGGSGATYALELLHASGYTECEPGNALSMLEGQSQGSMVGTFRVRATGFYGTSHVKVTATFKPQSFLDYVYFTQRETSDPVTYGKEVLIKAAERQCSKTIAEQRYAKPLTNEEGKYLTESGTTTTSTTSAEYCDVISFVGGDNIKGPMHTNDAFVFCESPTLGRKAGDSIEVSYPEKPGWFSTKQLPIENRNGCTGSDAKIKGTFKVNSPALVPPENNSGLEGIAEPTFHFTGEISICLEGTTITVGRGNTSCTASPLYSGPFPTNGVIYDSSESCSSLYTPFNVAYPSTTSGPCGNVNIIKGQYAKPLTIAAANDVLIKHNIEKTTEEGMLGLIATNFIRVYHPVELVHPSQCNWVFENGHYVQVCTENTSVTECRGNAYGSEEPTTKIEAALLALKHSFIVDNYRCGSRIGTLNVTGAIAQYYRGAVGTTGSNGAGYLKNYVYDSRLATTEPPSFIEPVKSDWVIGRETVE